MEEQLPLQAELIERIDWLIRLRWLAVVGTLMTIALANLLLPDVLPLPPLIIVATVIALYNVIFLFYARRLQTLKATSTRLRRSIVFACVQIVLDLLALTVLLHFAGGVENPFAVFFVFHMIIASILLPRTASFLVALLACLLYAGMVFLEYTGLVPHHCLVAAPLSLDLHRWMAFLLASVAAMTTTLFLVVYMTSSISARLRARNRDLMEVSARRRFMVLVTHELRAPVATLSSCLEFVLSGYGSPKKQKEVLGRAHGRARELLSLIGDLLELTKAQGAEARVLEAKPIQLADVLQSVCELMKVEADSKDLFLSVDIVPDLPLVRADPDQMKLVWTNLISNAIKYTEPGGIVVASLSHNPNYMVGAVRDTGIGIAHEDLPRIFEEFYRTANAKAVCPLGTGIGLSIVKCTIENYGGKVWVESELGRGSKFTFILPRVR